MSAYFIFTRERMRDPAAFEDYRALSRPALAGHPIKPLAVYGKCETLEGAPIDGAVILEFPDIAAAEAWYNSPAYTQARKERFRAGDYRAFLIEGV